jgi:hypothetical protein
MQMLKGHTKIELTDVNTGEVKVVEDDNIVTNAMAKMLESMPYCYYNVNCQNPFNSSLPYIDRFCGGILLFRDSIEEDPDNWLLPAGNRMTGNGRINYASPNDVPEFGAFNGEESYWNEETGERKYVYDFATSKANGTISCVALTNFLNGYWGLGNASGKKENMSVEKVSYNSTDLTTSYFWNSTIGLPSGFSCSNAMTHPVRSNILFADYDENCIYTFSYYSFYHDSSNSTKHIKYAPLKVSKVEFPFRSFSPMFKFGSEGINRIVKQIDIPVPSEISSMSTSYTAYFDICRTDDAVYLIFCNFYGYVEANKDIYVWKIGYDLETSEFFKMKNTTGQTLSVGNSYCGAYQTTYVEDGYLICSANGNGRIFKIKMSDPTDVTELENLAGHTSTSYFIKMGNNLIANCSHIGRSAIIDLNDNKVYPVNGTWNFGNTDYGRYTLIPIRGKDNFLIKSRDNSMDSSSQIIYNPSFMSTINNLPEPVVKTSDLTMKITYTLTPLGDEEEGDS